MNEVAGKSGLHYWLVFCCVVFVAWRVLCFGTPTFSIYQLGVLFILIVLITLFNRYSPVENFLVIFIFSYLLVSVPVFSMVKLELGEQGTDFALFCHLFWNVSTGEGLVSTIHQPSRMEYLKHHFSPALFALGWIANFFSSPEFFTLTLNTTLIPLNFLLVYRLFKNYDVNNLVAGGLLCYLYLLAPVRNHLYYDFREEILGLPLVLTSLLFIARSKTISSLCAIGLFFIKENLAFIGGVIHLILGLTEKSLKLKFFFLVVSVSAIFFPYFYGIVQKTILNHPSFFDLRTQNFLSESWFFLKLDFFEKFLQSAWIFLPVIFNMWNSAHNIKHILLFLFICSLIPSVFTSHEYLGRFYSYYGLYPSVFFVLLLGVIFARVRHRNICSLVILTVACVFASYVSPRENLWAYLQEYFSSSKNPRDLVFDVTRKKDTANNEDKDLVLATFRALSLVCSVNNLSRLSFFQKSPNKAWLIIVDRRDIGYPDERRMAKWIEKITKTHELVGQSRHTLVFTRKNSGS